MDSLTKIRLTIGWCWIAFGIYNVVTYAANWLIVIAAGAAALSHAAVLFGRLRRSRWVLSLFMLPIVGIAIWGMLWGNRVSWVWLLLEVVTFAIFWLPATQQQFANTDGRLAEFRGSLKMAGLVSFGLASIAFVSFETENVRMALLKMRLESKCHDPSIDIESCGQLALQRIWYPTDDDEFRAGQSMLQTMCEDGQSVACRNFLSSRSTWSLEKIQYRDWRAKAWDECKAQGGTACVATAFLTFDEFPEEFGEVVSSGCRQGDRDACVAWAAWADTDRSAAAAHQAGCHQGVVGLCATSEADARDRATMCSKSRNPEVCYLVNPEVACQNSVPIQCETRVPNDGRQKSGPKDSSDAPADLVARGFEILNAQAGRWRPDAMKARDIQKTFGRACDQNYNPGCVAAALATLNVQLEYLDSARVTAGAEYLRKSCELGDSRSCMYGLSTTNADPEAAFKQTREACLVAPRRFSHLPVACRSYAALWLHREKLVPGVMDDSLTVPDTIDLCKRTRDHRLCQWVAQSLSQPEDADWPEVMQRNVTAWDASAIACAKRDSYGCSDMMKISRAWPRTPTQSPDDLAASVCAKVPQMCDVVREKP